MEYHIVYRKCPDASVNRRQHQRAQLERVAVFSTYEEARLYIQMIALIDMYALGKETDENYFLNFRVVNIGYCPHFRNLELAKPEMVTRAQMRSW